MYSPGNVVGTEKLDVRVSHAAGVADDASAGKSLSCWPNTELAP